MKLHSILSWVSALGIAAARFAPRLAENVKPIAGGQNAAGAPSRPSTTASTLSTTSTTAAASSSYQASSTVSVTTTPTPPPVTTHDDSFIPDAVLRVTEEDRKQSCVPFKAILVVNGTSPGPTLRFKEGKTVWIRVYNDIPHQNLTMHWHGLTMATAPFSDGTPQAAQWPIPSNHFFDYELHVPIGMAGTYFYHSHVGFQATSATGPLIIEEKRHSPYYYDDDRILLIQDVFPDTDEFIEKALLAVPMAYERAQEIVLINGKGGGKTSEQRPCNDSLSVINVEPGKVYRVRLIGGTGLSFNKMALEGHPNLQLIECDGAYTEPFDTPFMQIGPGQRFSFLLRTLDKPDKDHYHLQVESREFGGPHQSFAIFNYGKPATNSTPPVYPPAVAPLDLGPTDSYWTEYSLRPYNNTAEHPTASYNAMNFPTAQEVTRRVNITSHLSFPGGALLYKINGYTWNEQTVHEPYLVQLYRDGGANWPNMDRAIANDGLGPITYAFPAKMGEVLEIVVQSQGSEGGGTETHPWHAHGAHYWDLGAGKGVYDPIENEARWRSSKCHPVKRDTTNVYAYGGAAPPNALAAWRAWRIRIDTPGVWMIHCHLLPHMVWGMNTAWVMGTPEEVLGRIDRPGVEGYLDFGGSVVGNETTAPQVVDFFSLTEWEDGDVIDDD